MQAAGVEEVQGEVDVHVAEEHEDVAPGPGMGPDVQAAAPGELLVHRDQGVVGEALLAGENQTERGQLPSPIIQLFLNYCFQNNVM